MDEDPLPAASHATALAGSSPLFSPQFHALKSSSPPPLFSEDNSIDSADATIYESPRLKRKRVGTWWQTGARAAIKRRQFARNFDSGVHMMSDDSDLSAVSSGLRSSFGFDGGPDIPSDPPAPEHQDEGVERSTQTMTDPEHQFYNSIQSAVEENATSYIFMDSGIKDSWLPHLNMLNQVVAIPPDASTEVPDEGQYRSMEPQLHLNLAQNVLCRLSPTLFNLQYLTGLTLRQNAIKNLPPQIAQLTNLRTLDLCYNMIRTLPCELLSLCQPQGKLASLALAGNPLCEMGDMHDGTHFEIDKRLDSKLDHLTAFSALANASGGTRFPEDFLARELRYKLSRTDFYGHHLFTPTSSDDDTSALLYLVSRTTAAYYDQTGRLVNGCPPLPMQEEASHHPKFGPRTQPGLMIHTSIGAHNVPATWFNAPSRSKVPSLFTRSLITAYNFCEGQPEAVREELSAYMGTSDVMPLNAEINLEVGDHNIAEFYKPLRDCHCCGKEYIVPRAEWIEGWYFDQQVVPIRLAVCSWGCVPDIIAKRPGPLKWPAV